MKCYIQQINKEKSNFVFDKNGRKEEIHVNNMENIMGVLYRFFYFFKYYKYRKYDSRK